MKPCIIKQPAGIGDIFFCQKLAKIMMAHDYSVIWPVREDILWIGDYIKDITFVPEHWNFSGPNCVSKRLWCVRW